MTIISKVLAVFVAAASLAFLGFVAVTLKAGTNWEGEARRVAHYQLTTTPGSEGRPPTHGFDPLPADKSEIDVKPVPSTRVLAEAIIRAQTNIQDEYKKRIDILDQRIAGYEQEIARFKAEKAVDQLALRARIEELRKLLDEADEQNLALSKQADLLSQQATAELAEAENRRNEGKRLTTELAAITAEKYRWQSQKKILEDRLVRLRQSIMSLERRQTQLKADSQLPAGN